MQRWAKGWEYQEMGVRGVEEGDGTLAEDGDGGLVCDF